MAAAADEQHVSSSVEEPVAFVPSPEHEEAIQTWFEAITSRKFFVCLDGSADSDLALKTAIELCNPDLADELFVCTAVKDKHVKASGHKAPAEGVYIMDRESWQLFADKESRLVLTKAMHTIDHVNQQRAKVPNRKPISYTTHVVCGKTVREALVAAARSVSAQFVVIGSRGLSPIKELRVGSVSQYVSHNAGCPVILVRPNTH